MAGDLAGRLPVAGTGDELDRLAEQLNAMLERIEALMRGLKEVSDNIAHDLKTPLTRLRNRCEQALRGPTGEADYRAALESTIAESDELIRTFDALLMIARAESGQARDNMTEFDAAEIARDVGELYEPLADEKGIALTVDAPAAAPVRGNRELVSQALANLVDNAIKYAGPNGNGIERRAGARSWSRPAMTASASRSAWPIAGRAFPKPIAAAWSSASCGSNRAARSRAPGLGLSLAVGGRAAARRRIEARGQSSRPAQHHRAAARGAGRGRDETAAPVKKRPKQKRARSGIDPAACRRAAGCRRVGRTARAWRRGSRALRRKRRRQGARGARCGSIRRWRGCSAASPKRRPISGTWSRPMPARFLRLLDSDPDGALAALLAQRGAPPRRRARRPRSCAFFAA